MNLRIDCLTTHLIMFYFVKFFFSAPPPRRPNPYMCGIKGTQRKETPRVVGGSDSSPGEWCWQVFVRIPYSRMSDILGLNILF